MTAAALILCLLFQVPVYAAPAEPSVQAQGAVVIDGASGQVLYGKNANTGYYPASITKLMTALLVIERCSLDETVTFSASATSNLESGAVSLGLTEGDRLTVRQCLYALLLKSANEVGNALAEHVSGSVAAFAELMNQKAAALGCTGTHFTNPHGLNDSNHYTTPRDMALIARAAFQNETLRKIDTTLSYNLPATKNSAARTITMGHKMMYPTDSRYYEGIIGGKTGYTSKAGNTLVTGAERNGVRVIAVVMKANGTHYADTKALLDYGFEKLGAGGGSGQRTENGPGQQAGQQTGAGPGQQAPGNGNAPAFQGPRNGNASASQAPGTGNAPASQAPGTGNAPAFQGPGNGNASAPQAPGTGNAAAPQAPGSGNAAAPQAPGTGNAPASQAPGNENAAAPQAPGDGNAAAPQDPRAGSSSAVSQTAPGSRSGSGWEKDGTGWYYVKENGTRAAGEWLNLSDGDYWIDSGGYMAVGWRNFGGGDWRYFRGSGRMAENCWIEDGGKWFYVGENGTLLRNTSTPDGYTVGGDGVWVP